MKRFGTPIAMLLLGLFVGTPTGFFFAQRDNPGPTTNPDTLNLTLPKDFFADLPKAEDGKQRLIDVDTFTFEKLSTSGASEEKVVVLPRVALANASNAKR